MGVPVVRRGRRLVAVLALVLGGVGAAAAAPAPVGAVVVLPTLQRASGTFTAVLSGPPVLAPLAGGRCEVTATGTFIFTGTLDGQSPGTTTAMVVAPCSEVDLQDPDFVDVFRYEGTFTGTVAGRPVQAPLTYTGVTKPGGSINAVLVLRTLPPIVLQADAMVAQGGTYSGVFLR